MAISTPLTAAEFVVRLLLAHCLRSPIGPVDVETLVDDALHDKLQGLEVIGGN